MEMKNPNAMADSTASTKKGYHIIYHMGRTCSVRRGISHAKMYLIHEKWNTAAKNAAKWDNVGAVCNSIINLFFLCILSFFFLWGGVRNFFVEVFFFAGWQFILIQFKSKCVTAKLSLSLCVLFSWCSWYVAFVELIHLNDLLDDVTFPLLTNQRPRKCDKTER